MRDPENGEPCAHCASLIVANHSTFHKPDYISKHRLFHPECQECLAAEQRQYTTLCEQCQHLRPRHLLTCFPSTELCTSDEVSISIDPFGKGISSCDFCRY